MPFYRDLCDLSDHDSDVEAPSCKERGARVGPEVRSGPSREAKKARVDETIKDAQRSLSTRPTSPLQSFSPTNATVGRTAPDLSIAIALIDGVRLRMISFNKGQWQNMH